MSDEMKKVKGPDGKVYKFPSDMSFDRIDAIMSEQYGSNSTPKKSKRGAIAGAAQALKNSGFFGSIPVVGGAVEAMPDKAQENVVSGALGVAQGGTFSLGDEIVGAINPSMGKALKQAQTLSREENPLAHLGGEIVGGAVTGGGAFNASKALGVKVGAKGAMAAGGGVYAAGDAQGSLVNRLPSAATGVVLGVAGGMVMQKAGSAISGLLSKGQFVQDGKLTDEAIKVIRSSGINPDELSSQDIQDIITISSKGTSPDEALRVTDAQSLPVPVPLTQGQKTLNNDDLRMQLTARDGAMGRPAERVARDAEQTQSDLMRRNVQALRQGMGGDGSQVALTEGGMPLARRIASDAEAAKAKAVALRREAEGGRAIAPKSLLNNVVGEIKADLQDNGIVPGTKIYDAIDGNFLRRADAIMQQSNRGGTPIQTLIKLRRDLSEASKTVQGSGSAKLGEIGTKLEKALEDALDQAVITGDTDTIQKFKKSTKLFREYYDKYDGQKGAKKILADIANGSTAADEASAKIFGKKNFGGTAKAAELAREIKSMVGTQSPEWQALRQEAFTRIIKESESGEVGLKFSTNLERIMRSDGPTMREFFTPSEILAMRRLARVTRTINASPTGRSNPSQSSLGNEFIKRVGGSELTALVRNLPVVREVVDGISDVRKANKIKRLVEPK